MGKRCPRSAGESRMKHGALQDQLPNEIQKSSWRPNHSYHILQSQSQIHCGMTRSSDEGASTSFFALVGQAYFPCRFFFSASNWDRWGQRAIPCRIIWGCESHRRNKVRNVPCTYILLRMYEYEHAFQTCSIPIGIFFSRMGSFASLLLLLRSSQNLHATRGPENWVCQESEWSPGYNFGRPFFRMHCKSTV